MSDEWFTVCDENDILLEKNDSNDYKISLNIYENPENEFSSIDIIKEGQLFDLLFELNNDIIENIDQSIIDNNINLVTIVSLNKEKKKKNIYLKYKSEINDNLCIITGVPFEDKNEVKDDEIYLDNFNIKLEKGCPTSLSVILNSNNFLDEDSLINIFLSLFIKKIFNKFKKYFE